MGAIYILLVEDDGIIGKHIQVSLKNLGYAVPYVVPTGEEAVQIAIQSHPDLVLMDIALQGKMDGVDAAVRIRESLDIPMVYLTAYSDAALLERVKATGPFGYLIKPFEEHSLHAAIEMALTKHRLEQQLRQSEERYRAVTELTSDYAYSIHFDSQNQPVLDWVTGGFTRIIGYTQEEIMQLGGMAALIYPEDVEIARQHQNKFYSAQDDVAEYRVCTKSGQVRWLRSTIHPLVDPQTGRVLRLYGAAQDINASKEAEAAIRESEERYRQLFERSQVGVFYYDLNLVFTDCNERFVQILQSSRQRLIGLDLRKLKDQRIVPAFLKTLDGQDGLYEGQYCATTSGAVIWVSMQTTPLFDAQGRVKGGTGIIEDVTQQVLAENALRESEQRFRMITENAREFVWMSDLDGHMIYVSPSMSIRLGYPSEEVIKMHPLDLVYPDDLARIKDWREEKKAEFRILKADGSWIWVEGSNYQLDMGGQSYLVSISSDITDRRHAEEELALNAVRYRGLFENSPISLWEEDFSGVKQIVDNLRRQGVSDFRAYFIAHSEVILECERQVKVIDVNQATLKLFRAASKDELIRGLPKVLGEEAAVIFLEELVAIGEEKTEFEGEGQNHDLDGNLIDIRLRWSVAPGCEDSLTNVIVSVQDITARKQRERELEGVARVSTALRAAQTRAAMPQVILEQLLQVLRAEAAALAIRDELSGEIVYELSLGNWELETGMRIPPGAGVTGRVFTTGIPYLTNDVSHDPYALKFASIQRLQALICAPLISRQQTIGALVVARQVDFSPADLRLLVALADITANAIFRAALHEQTERYVEQLAAVSAIGRALAETLSLPEIYARLAQAVQDLLPNVMGMLISFYDPQQKVISCAYGVMDGKPIDISSLAPVKLAQAGEGTQSRVIYTRRPLIVDQLEKQVIVKTLVGSPELTAQSALLVPMLAKGDVLGILQVQSHQANNFTDVHADLLTLVANSAAITIDNARLFKATEHRLERLAVLHTLDTAITTSLDLTVTLNILLSQVVSQLHLDAADVLLFNSHTQSLEFAAGNGFRSNALARTQIRLGRGFAGQVALERHILHLPRLGEATPNDPRQAAFALEGFEGYTAAPLVAKGQVKGVLEIFHRSEFLPDREWLDFLETLAGQTAIAIDNATLFNDLQRSNLELTLAYDITLEGWSRALDLRDKETEGHTQRVVDMTLQLARGLHVPEVEWLHIRRGALLHDIGKMGIPDRILHKPGPLTSEEWDEMRRHPVYAHELLTPIQFLRQSLDIPYCHHEKWDGTGYPRGLQGEQIPLAARIFAVVDVWDALLSERSYRPAWRRGQVYEYIRSQAGKHFDPRVVEVFLALVPEEL